MASSRTPPEINPDERFKIIGRVMSAIILVIAILTGIAMIIAHYCVYQ